MRTDATAGGTTMVQDINPNLPNADPTFPVIFNSKIIFGATDGDNATETDLYTVDGSFIPLPVRVIDFTVSLKTSDALLSWNTAQELNTRNYTIQRSFDAQHFEDIGTVQAVGTTANRHAYSFTDAGITNRGKDVVFYRLLASDKDGKTENTNIISLKMRGTTKWDVRLLSNPVKDNVKILLSGTTGGVQLSVKDVSGKTIYKNSIQNVNGQFNLPVNLQPGIYVLMAETNNERKAIKFVK